MVVNKNININIDSYPISMAISIVPNIVEIDIEIEILLTPVAQIDQLSSIAKMTPYWPKLHCTGGCIST